MYLFIATQFNTSVYRSKSCVSSHERAVETDVVVVALCSCLLGLFA